MLCIYDSEASTLSLSGRVINSNNGIILLRTWRWTYTFIKQPVLYNLRWAKCAERAEDNGTYNIPLPLMPYGNASFDRCSRQKKSSSFRKSCVRLLMLHEKCQRRNYNIILQCTGFHCVDELYYRTGGFVAARDGGGCEWGIKTARMKKTAFHFLAITRIKPHNGQY